MVCTRLKICFRNSCVTITHSHSDDPLKRGLIVLSFYFLLFDFVPEVNVHFPVAAVVGAIIKFELEGSSVPNVVVTLGHSDGVLRPALHDPGALLFVAIPPHEAAGLEAIADKDDLLIKVGAFESGL